ncbi:MAG: hypothetical protein OXK19_01560 [Candidatus Dadabacteria bacterium]|nr:hypothetical protein [Candidatus Dadabacteria bacterium]
MRVRIPLPSSHDLRRKSNEEEAAMFRVSVSTKEIDGLAACLARRPTDPPKP